MSWSEHWESATDGTALTLTCKAGYIDVTITGPSGEEGDNHSCLLEHPDDIEALHRVVNEMADEALALSRRAVRYRRAVAKR